MDANDGKEFNGQAISDRIFCWRYSGTLEIDKLDAITAPIQPNYAPSSLIAQHDEHMEDQKTSR